MLPRCLSNFRAIGQFQIQISRLRDFAISYHKTSYRILKQGPSLCKQSRYDYFNSTPPCPIYTLRYIALNYQLISLKCCDFCPLNSFDFTLEIIPSFMKEIILTLVGEEQVYICAFYLQIWIVYLCNEHMPYIVSHETCRVLCRALFLCCAYCQNANVALMNICVKYFFVVDLRLLKIIFWQALSYIYIYIFRYNMSKFSSMYKSKM